MAVDLENLVCEEVAVNAVIQWLSSSSDKVIFTVIVNSATQQRQRIRVTIIALFCVSLPSRLLQMNICRKHFNLYLPDVYTRHL